MNSINLIGNICNDLELKSTTNGKYVCSFNLAVKRPFTKDTTDFISVVVWDKKAEILSKYANKGSKIGVVGSLTTRKYTDKDGKDQNVFEVVANDVFLLDKKESRADVNIVKEPNDFTEISGMDLPFN